MTLERGHGSVVDPSGRGGLFRGPIIAGVPRPDHDSERPPAFGMPIDPERVIEPGTSVEVVDIRGATALVME